MVNETQYLDQNCPAVTQSTIAELNFNNKNFEGGLYLAFLEFTNIRTLNVSFNQLNDFSSIKFSKACPTSYLINTTTVFAYSSPLIKSNIAFSIFQDSYLVFWSFERMNN
ncbi:6835_t:CDS:2 [Gigaspora margarita]|uniref:6835_t:CDS:1 n=1 Tax=Gigaspora margarita TaxID=4874 RepID=A0ABM8W512_GIGMA|nr:6835_t:CDS:2 [Gigaspora margarita]